MSKLFTKAEYLKLRRISEIRAHVRKSIEMYKGVDLGHNVDRSYVGLALESLLYESECKSGRLA